MNCLAVLDVMYCFCSIESCMLLLLFWGIFIAKLSVYKQFLTFAYKCSFYYFNKIINLNSYDRLVDLLINYKGDLTMSENLNGCYEQFYFEV